VNKKIAVVIPSYKVTRHILGVLEKIGPEVARIYVVDDCCPENSGDYVRKNCSDSRVQVIIKEKNGGVGSATKTGMRQAALDGFDILVKLDGDGQMDPRFINTLVRPIREELADYTKGNRFNNPRSLSQMPAVRLFGNSVLSFLTKLSSGYWQIMDPTNGYVAIHSKVFQCLETDKIADRYFFETDMLFRLHLVGAVVVDIPMSAFYGDEKSNLSVKKIIGPFLWGHLTRFYKRIIYDYYVHDFNVGSLQLTLGLMTFLSGSFLGLYHWTYGLINHQSTEFGIISLVMILMVLGFQLLISALQYDISNKPEIPLQKVL
jgi:dolichol-phosphate mannosyltransferase